jgi:hypothetical protein
MNANGGARFFDFKRPFGVLVRGTRAPCRLVAEIFFEVDMAFAATGKAFF